MNDLKETFTAVTNLGDEPSAYVQELPNEVANTFSSGVAHLEGYAQEAFSVAASGVEQVYEVANDFISQAVELTSSGVNEVAPIFEQAANPEFEADNKVELAKPLDITPVVDNTLSLTP